MHPIITSHQNPKIKNILALEKSRERNRQGQFTIEGIRELSLAIVADYKLTSVFFCPDIITATALIEIVKDEALLIPVDRSVFEKIVYREGTEGIVAVAAQKQHLLENVKLGKNPIILVLEGVEKPGNLGAMLRTADAAQLDAVIICETKTDFYNPNVIRSSVGCLFTMQTAAASGDHVIEWLRRNNIQMLVTDLQAAKPYHEANYQLPTAIIMGTESTGISPVWKNNATHNIIIPMRGTIDSLNVSNAAAIIIFEAARQRGFN